MKPSAGFKRILNAAENDTEIIPILYGYLERGGLPDPFTVVVRGGTGNRKPDGWFHPSTHPLMTERQLYYYLADPEHWEKPPFDYTIKMSATIGSVVHDIVETALKDLGYLIEPKGVCVACGRPQPQECREHGAIDLKTGSRGHMDGVVLLRGVLKGFEFKTSHPRAIQNIESNDVAAFRKKWPYYYSQVQEYLRMTGMSQYKVLFWSMGNPWDMREFTIFPDLEFHLLTERKYLAVREMVAAGEMPQPCCVERSKESKECPALRCPRKSY